MAFYNTKESTKEYNNFLAAFQELKFSKLDQDLFRVLNVERRCLGVKYLAAKRSGFEDAAMCLLEKGLKEFQYQIEKSGVYWNSIENNIVETVNDPSQWKSELNDVQTAIDFIECLPCQDENTAACKEKVINDGHIKDIVDMWKTQDTRKRKCNIQRRPQFETIKTNDNKISHANKSSISNEMKFIECNKKELPSLRNGVSLFKTARDELNIQQNSKNRPAQKKTLGGKSSVKSPFVCPLKREEDKVMQYQNSKKENEGVSADVEDERMKNIDPKLIELIKNEIMDLRTSVSWDDIAGLEYAKKIIQEVIVFPMLRPDIFTGLRRPPRGILLFGPPGTGKTLIGRCIAVQSKSTFFSISASSLTSKWIGEGEKMVRALFAVARVNQPSVVFIDEIDSLLSQRSETEHESSRRLKTEFLVQLDGAATSEDDRILIVGATNRPQELDEAARRRLVKRLYIPLPELQARKQIICNLLSSVKHNVTEQDITDIAQQAEGYSGADMKTLCTEASMGPIRCIPYNVLQEIPSDEITPVTLQDFKEALQNVRPSVSQSDLAIYVNWDRTYGTGSLQNDEAVDSPNVYKDKKKVFCLLRKKVLASSRHI
ncbi:PREDICTED: fidgetin-like protein 1 isoform X3 [Polistes canadensis]|uniref:fidgetin-like protein 1 isoform X3 n=1 Tax=Polistes canadensis TaxID=91411 RepID=UPI000718CF9E|nr:PREDICTED: fidgetin-like protein 1 isoform X3 [Polistes canadensis]